jgi:hypothetical protein
MADQTDVELQIEIVRARNDWSREKRQHEVRQQIAEIDENRIMLRRCDQSLMRERERLMQELPREEPAREAMPRAVTEGPRQPPLPAHLRPKEQATG